MAKFQGFVNKLATKEGTSKKPPYRPWTLYSFILEHEDGSDSPWISFGFEKAPFVEGEFISFETDEKDGRHNYKKGSGSKPANPPQRAKARTSGGTAVANGNTTGTKAGTGAQGATAGSAATADRQTSIVMQHSQEMAISAVAVLLSNNALPMSGAASKAGEAKRFSEITAMMDKLTVKFYNDAATGRLLETVADTVVDTAPDAALPAGKKKAEGKASTSQTEATGSEDDLAEEPADAPAGF